MIKTRQSLLKVTQEGVDLPQISVGGAFSIGFGQIVGHNETLFKANLFGRRKQWNNVITGTRIAFFQTSLPKLVEGFLGSYGPIQVLDRLDLGL